MKLAIPLLSIVGLSGGLILPRSLDSAGVPRNGSLWTLGVSNHNPDILIRPNPQADISAGSFGAWPDLPFSFDTGFQLYINITQLGHVTAQARKDDILNDLDELYYDIIAQGDAFAIIPKAATFSHGIVYAFFGSKPHAEMRISQAAQIISALWYSSVKYGPREILVAEVTMAMDPIATLALRFSEAKEQS